MKFKLTSDIWTGALICLTVFSLILFFSLPVLSHAYTVGESLRSLQIFDRSVVPNRVPFFLVFLVPVGSLTVILSAIFFAWSLKKFGRNFKTGVIAILPSLAIIAVCIGVVIYYDNLITAMADYVTVQRSLGPLPLNKIELELRSLQFNCFLLAWVGPPLALLAVGGLCQLALSESASDL